MLVVTVTLHSAVTGEVTELGRMIIANDGTGSYERGNYDAKVARKGVTDNRELWHKPLRTARVENYPRWSYTIWELVRRALNGLYGGPSARGCGHRAMAQAAVEDKDAA